MIIGYILVGMIAGLITSITSLVLGASLWSAVGLYILTGSAVLIVLPALHIAGSHLIRSTGTAAAPSIISVPQATLFAAPSEAAAGARVMQILAVDDDPFIRDLLPVICADAGHCMVTLAASGKEALKLLAAGDKTFDYLLFDISMPDMDGITLCQHTRQLSRYQQTPIVMLTALRDMDSMSEAFRAGATDYATKPFDVAKLASRLRLAQEAIATAHAPTLSDQNDATQEAIEPVRCAEVATSRHIWPAKTETVIDQAALANYLTQLHQRDLSGLHIFAIRIDQTDASAASVSSLPMTALLADAAAETADWLGSARTIMSNTDTSELLVVTDTDIALPATNLERNIEERLQQRHIGAGTDVVISVGAPVHVQGAKEQRARMAINHALACAHTRALDRQGNMVLMSSVS